uniref:S-protein homolog n=1 Tax=Nicotiana sylvestris TaxID=4096 RepID=A0A1U7Y9Y1_NICSY|nr:PREDICTED: uncharacterized protein LOC104246751 [Nicotiana sylvestris]
MDYSQIKTIFLLFIFFFCFPQAKGNIFKGKKYTVAIHNFLPNDNPPLYFHCASGDDDLGYHSLAALGQFSWSFRPNMWLWARTIFFCHFWWGSKNKAFVVYNDFDYCVHSANVPKTTYCQWTVETDGIYLSNGEGVGYRYVDW